MPQMYPYLILISAVVDFHHHHVSPAPFTVILVLKSRSIHAPDSCALDSSISDCVCHTTASQETVSLLCEWSISDRVFSCELPYMRNHSCGAIFADTHVVKLTKFDVVAAIKWFERFILFILCELLEVGG